jgi:hypothetical protein
MKNAAWPGVPSYEAEPVTVSSPRAIHPRAFSNLFVEVSITNPLNAQLATERLEFFGATIVTGAAADVILTDSSLAPARDRGHPKIVSLQQVPWALWPEKKLMNILEPPNKNVVVADFNRKYRPIYKAVAELPRLYLDAVPRRYSTTPFVAVPEKPPNHDCGAFKRGHIDIGVASPPDHSYCELCLLNFAEAEEHHRSKEHQRRVNSACTFFQLDELIAEIAALGRIWQTDEREGS